jgi:hypothetical protein
VDKGFVDRQSRGVQGQFGVSSGGIDEVDSESAFSGEIGGTNRVRDAIVRSSVSGRRLFEDLSNEPARLLTA